ncbi:MAG TPA: VOC family protein [Solirubrobacterales bacterium]|nr:VOC family protein [Solirubrobacterales bacterium]
MDIKINSAYLPHDDPDGSIAFYRDKLGWELRQDVGYNGMRWLTFGASDQPDTAIVLYPPGAEGGLTDEERSTIAAMMAKGTFGRINLASADLDGEFERLRAADVEVVEEPTDMQHGLRECAIRDPAGNLIRIRQV